MNTHIKTTMFLITGIFLIASCKASPTPVAATPQFDRSAVGELSPAEPEKKTLTTEPPITPPAETPQNVKKPETTAATPQAETTKTAQSIEKPKPENNKQIYKNISDTINTQCPIQIDSHLRMDSASYSVKLNEFCYNYTLLDSEKTKVTETQLAKAKKASRALIIKKLKANRSLYQFRQDKVIMVCTYSDKQGKLLFVVKIAPSEY